MPGALAVIRVDGLGWCDLGDAVRGFRAQRALVQLANGLQGLLQLAVVFEPPPHLEQQSRCNRDVKTCFSPLLPSRRSTRQQALRGVEERLSRPQRIRPDPSLDGPNR